MSTTEIPYLTKNWRPVDGCTPVSDGCDNCYALRNAKRWKRSFQVTTRPERLEEPLHWRKPQRVGVCFHGDLFHEKVPDEFLDKVFAVMALTPQHTYVLLTKRPERMRAYLTMLDREPTSGAPTRNHIAMTALSMSLEALWANPRSTLGDDLLADERGLVDWPLPNVWLGVSVENQQAADERIPLLLETPAAHRWLSVEPLLGPLDLHRVSPGLLGTSAIFDALGGRRWEDNGETINATACARLDWVVVGGESGPHARECPVEWIAYMVGQHEAAGVPLYVKQDSGPRPGQQGRIPDALWAVKQLPDGWA